MPAEGLPWLPRAELLSDAEILRVIAVAVSVGIDDIRFTGGEPLLRPGLLDLVAASAALDPRPRISLTTNGLGLARLAEPLRAAGLDRVNVSLDTLDRQTFRLLTRRDRLADVLAGLAAAKAAGLDPVKVNAVLIRDVNDSHGPELLDYCLENGYQLRFIEQMPLDAQHSWDRSAMITAQQILDRLAQRYLLTPLGGRGAAPAELFAVDGGPAVVGVIGSVSRPFCAACDRVRLTADGQLRNCLFATSETDVRSALRDGRDDQAIAQVLQAAVGPKKAGHGLDDPGFLQPVRTMSAIGG